MRQAAQAKAGFYPADSLAISEAMKFIRPPSSGRFHLLDPCCGEGRAIGQVAGHLACPERDVYAIELGQDRAATAASILPGANVIGPADYFGTSITNRSFSFVWLNPPFDDELGGGGRVEQSFLARATNQLVTGGVLAFVCTERVSASAVTEQFLRTHYDKLAKIKFPEQCRRFNEVVLFGVKRSKAVVSSAHWWNDNAFVAPRGEYILPNSPGPRQFEKSNYTEDELLAALQNSPLRRHLQATPDTPLPRPPMALGKGHRALLLTSGFLDGLVEPPGEPPHAIRGSTKKVNYTAAVEVEEHRGGGTTTTTTIRQRIALTVRAIGTTGPIKTFGEGISNGNSHNEETDNAAPAVAETETNPKRKARTRNS